MHIKDEDKAADGSVSVCLYDKAKLNEAKMQLVMSAGIAIFVHYKWAYTQPLVMMGFMQPMNVLTNPAIRCHLFGKTDIERPFKADNANNPLAQWAERKKAEQEEANKKS